MRIKFEEELAKNIFKEIKPKLEDNAGIAIFAQKRAKFEGWLKVELCESLSKDFSTITPENNRIDITFNDCAIELKTVNTSYKYENVEKKTRPITNNIQGIINDIKKLRDTNYRHKAVLFVVFPLDLNRNHKEWNTHLKKISKFLKDENKDKNYQEFKFKNGVPGVIYFCLIR